MAKEGKRLPDEFEIHVPTGERALAWARTERENVAIATTGHVIVVDDGEVVLRRPWGDVDHVVMDGDATRLSMSWVDGAAGLVLDLTLTAASVEFARRVKERVDRSIVYQESDVLPGGGRLRGIVRRNPDGSLFSQVLAQNTRSLPPDIDERAESMEQRVRAAVGLSNDEASGRA